MKPTFPPDFLFGSATSAHQIEGGNHNTDWWWWEQQRGTIVDGNNSDGGDSWKNWREDIRLLKETGQNFYRFSIEWARVVPKEGRVDRAALAHYREILCALREEKITPLVTLWHFTSPQWLMLEGGWASQRVPRLFADYVRVVMKELGELSLLWITLNEPNVYVQMGLLAGKWYPARRNPLLAALVWRQLRRGHQLAWVAIKKACPAAQVGLAVNMPAYLPSGWGGEWLAAHLRRVAYENLLRETATTSDFIGVNYYLTYRTTWRPPFVALPTDTPPPYPPRVRPDGLRLVLDSLRPFQKPIYITEHGIGDNEDELRPQYLRDSWEVLRQAVADGIPLKGYCHWSLLDNFEWASGYSLRFGLFKRDRQPKESARVYKKLISGTRPPRS